MDRHAATSRPPTRRGPLSDATNWANTAPTHHLHNKGESSPTGPLPHNVSFVANGTLDVHSGAEVQHSPENQRLSTPSKEDQSDSKRNSAISNTSTNASNTPNKRRKTHIGPWHLGKTIGKGGCSRVRLVQHMQTGQKGAAKIISKQVAEKARAVSMANLVEQARYDPTLEGGTVMPFGLEREIVIMKLLDHSNIVRLYDVWENRSELYLIMEYIPGGELFDFIQNYPSIEERYVVYLFRQIIAALLYCHRIHIHHRDLKPENILIDYDTMQIKLVDFGMAALQPEGKFLSTPCGSPNYAAPELLHFKSYDGSKADVWSCGVILYLMLTGTLPFNFPPDPRQRMSEHQKLHMLFAKIKAADYTMPSHIGKEARDLLYRIFQPNPARRIDIEGIWNHRFLHLYDKEFNLDPRMESWIGKRPKVNDWKPLARQDIDREIMRNMRMLWHSEAEDVLVERLVSEEPNHEKYFYSELLKHREEHLENYAGMPTMSYSASDYQHAKAIVDSSRLPPLPTVRSQSQYSILNDEHLQSVQSFHEPPPSDTSYDPFRASRDPVIKASRQYMNVTVHRGASNGSRALRATSIQHSHRSSGPLRVEALKRGSRVSSRKSGSSISLKHSSSHRLSTTRSVASRSSLGSSVWASSPPVVSVKPSSMHKRAVNFSHLRRSSTASALTSQTLRDERSLSVSPNHRKSLKRKQNGTETTLLTLASSPNIVPSVALHGKREADAKPSPRLRIRKPRDPNQVVAYEARKVSAELEKVCQEAFFRSSVCSTNRSSTSTDKQPSYLDTPPSSVTQCSPAHADKPTILNNNSSISNRPLPPLPSAPRETPKTFTARELAETRNRIAARYVEANGDNADYFKDVLAHLDSLLPEPIATGPRAISLPQPVSKIQADLGYLPAISEEDRFADVEDVDPEYTAPAKWLGRNITMPAGLKMGNSKDEKDDRNQDVNTIRLVDPSSPCPIAPLNIRKVSGASSGSGDATADQASPLASTVIRRHRKGPVPDFTIFEDPVEKTQSPSPNVPLIVTTAPPEDAPKPKKRGWFRRITSASEAPENVNGTVKKASKQPSPQRWQDLDDRIKANPLQPVGHKPRPSEATNSDTSEFPMRLNGSDKLEAMPKDEDGVRKGLWKLFRKRVNDKRGDEKVDRGLRLGSPADFSSSSLGQSYDIPFHSLQPSAIGAATEVQPTNWLAKFLHIRPASKVVCFQVGRGRVRQELVRLLRDWKRFGVRDVTFDRATNIVNFRIDKSNHLKIKPVSIVVELFVVLEHGRRAQLAVALFTQAKGAASSFKRTVEVLEDVMNAKGMVIEDKDKKAAMADILVQ